MSFIDTETNKVIFDEFEVDVQHGAFAEIAKAAIDMEGRVSLVNFYDSVVGMEIPPVSGMYAVKLWALDTRIYSLIKSRTDNIWLFNVPYLKFINGKTNSKQDTMKMIDDILEVFKFNDYDVVQMLKDKRGKDRKLTSNQCDSFLYCIRVFVKHSLETGENAELVQDILNVNERFYIEKETKLGKKIEED